MLALPIWMHRAIFTSAWASRCRELVNTPANLLTPERLAAEIARLAADPGRLARMAEAAKSAGTIDAAERLADVAMKVAERRTTS